MANSADPDQLASSEANWSGSTLFAKAGFIWVQQDKGFNFTEFTDCFISLSWTRMTTLTLLVLVLCAFGKSMCPAGAA